MPDLKLAKRKINTREAKHIEVFSLDEIKKHFNASEALIEKQSQLADNLMVSGKIEEAKDVLRSQIVFIDSAFDFYMHELLKLGIINLFHGDWTPKTEKYQNLKLDMKTLEAAISDEWSDNWLKEWIHRTYADQSLMSYEAFTGVCNLLGLSIKDIADQAFYDTNSRIPTKDKLRDKIDSLFKRRNQIAHQSDRKHENASREDITTEYVQDKLDDMKKIIEAVHFCAIQK